MSHARSRHEPPASKIQVHPHKKKRTLARSASEGEKTLNIRLGLYLDQRPLSLACAKG